jgi:uncharacterized membrane protein
MAAALAVAGGFGAVAIDHGTSAHLGFGGGVDGARSILATIAAAMITFTGLVFSITIVTLQLASSQFSPRVMRTFLRDRTTKLALSTFVATFVFALTVLRATRADAVPGIAVTLSIVLVLVSMGVFIHYIHHTAHAIRAVAVIESVAAETRACIDRNYPADVRPPRPVSSADDDSRAIVLTHDGDPGIVTGFDVGRLVAWGSSARASVRLRPGVGDFVPAGAPLLEVRGIAAPDRAVLACITIGPERTMQQDVAFGLRQLVDLASKALSPGINDPTTAVQAIDQIHDLLRRLALRPMLPGHSADTEGVVRLEYPTMTWPDYVSLGLDEVRIYGSGSLQVLRRLHYLVDDLLTIVEPGRSPPLHQQQLLLTAIADRTFSDAHDRLAARQDDAQGIGS